MTGTIGGWQRTKWVAMSQSKGQWPKERGGMLVDRWKNPTFKCDGGWTKREERESKHAGDETIFQVFFNVTTTDNKLFSEILRGPLDWKRQGVARMVYFHVYISPPPLRTQRNNNKNDVSALQFYICQLCVNMQGHLYKFYWVVTTS